jgi:hypothetical protein
MRHDKSMTMLVPMLGSLSYAGKKMLCNEICAQNQKHWCAYNQQAFLGMWDLTHFLRLFGHGAPACKNKRPLGISMVFFYD